MTRILTWVLWLSLSGTALAGAAWLLDRCFGKRLPRAARYYLWVLVLLRFLVPLASPFPGLQTASLALPVETAQPEVRLVTLETLPAQADLPQAEAAEPAVAAEAPQPAAQTIEALPEDQAAPAFDWKALPWREILGSLWLLGAAVSLTYSLVSYLPLAFCLRRETEKPSRRDLALFRRMYRGKRLCLGVCPGIPSAMLLGLVRPMVLLPEWGYCETGREAQLSVMLAHELTHYRRGDLLVKWATMLVSALHWFNPVLILLRRTLNRSCEFACDEAVLQGLDRSGRVLYGETLLDASAAQQGRKTMLISTFAAKKSTLWERVVHIAEFKKIGRSGIVASILALALLSGCAVAAGPALNEQDAPAALVADADPTGNLTNPTNSSAGIGAVVENHENPPATAESVVLGPASRIQGQYSLSKSPSLTVSLNAELQGAPESLPLYVVEPGEALSQNQIDAFLAPFEATEYLAYDVPSPFENEKVEPVFTDKYQRAREGADANEVLIGADGRPEAKAEPSDHTPAETVNVSWKNGYGWDYLKAYRNPDAAEDPNSELVYSHGRQGTGVQGVFTLLKSPDGKEAELLAQAEALFGPAMNRLNPTLTYALDYAANAPEEKKETVQAWFVPSFGDWRVTFTLNGVQGNNMRKNPWQGEYAAIQVDESGVRTFLSHNVNTRVAETLPAQRLLSAEAIAEKAQAAFNAGTFSNPLGPTSEWTQVTAQQLTIDEAVLGYAKVKMDDGRYAYVPVWDFFGSYDTEYASGEKSSSAEDGYPLRWSYLTLNALDGGVIHRENPEAQVALQTEPASASGLRYLALTSEGAAAWAERLSDGKAFYQAHTQTREDLQTLVEHYEELAAEDPNNDDAQRMIERFRARMSAAAEGVYDTPTTFDFVNDAECELPGLIREWEQFRRVDDEEVDQAEYDARVSQLEALMNSEPEDSGVLEAVCDMGDGLQGTLFIWQNAQGVQTLRWTVQPQSRGSAPAASKVTEDEARNTAKAFLEKLGLNGMKEKSLTFSPSDEGIEEAMILYVREDASIPTGQRWMLQRESLTLKISSRGVVELSWQNPVEVTAQPQSTTASNGVTLNLESIRRLALETFDRLNGKGVLAAGLRPVDGFWTKDGSVKIHAFAWGASFEEIESVLRGENRKYAPESVNNDGNLAMVEHTIWKLKHPTQAAHGIEGLDFLPVYAFREDQLAAAALVSHTGLDLMGGWEEYREGMRALLEDCLLPAGLTSEDKSAFLTALPLEAPTKAGQAECTLNGADGSRMVIRCSWAATLGADDAPETTILFLPPQ